MYFEANGGNRVEPLEVISKFYSIWISHGELRALLFEAELSTHGRTSQILGWCPF